MAKLYVGEYPDNAGSFSNWAVQVARDPPIIDQTPVAIGAVAAASAPFNNQTRVIRLHCDAVCSILIGPAGETVATQSNQRLAANQTEYKLVLPGYVVSVIANT